MTREMRDYVKGLILERFSSPIPSTPAQKEPVAYLYNGVRLPALPEWDKETYPYAEIDYGTPYGEAYMLRAFKSSSVRVDNEERLVVYSDTEYLLCSITWDYVNSAFETEWSEWSVIEPKDEDVHLFNPIWSNFELLNEDNSVYLAASEPIPIYE